MILTKLRQFLYRNRRRLLITTGISALLYLSYQYLISKFQEYQQRLTEERFSREQIKRRFEQTQKDSLYTVYSLVPVLNNGIFESLAVEKITRDLQARRLEKGKSNVALNGSQVDDVSTTTATNATNVTEATGAGEVRKSKNELWNDLKIMSLTRLLTLIYAQSSLILLTRLQLNILARREYLEDAIKLASSKHGFVKKEFPGKDQRDEASYVNEQAYLSLSWWLLNRGWVSIRQRVERAVRETFKDITPRAELTLDDFALLLNKTQYLIEQSSDSEADQFTNLLLSTVLPPANLQNFVFQQTLDYTSCSFIGKDSDSLQVLIEETQNYINSPSVGIVMNSLATSGISTALNTIAHYIHNKPLIQPTDQDTETHRDISQRKLKLAVLLANVGKVANEFKTYPENSFINSMDSAEGLDELSASVYSNFEV
ncbi:hypothetical protein WICPIJ_009485 [Wickerhamomyces pijperi]|uniref:Peroxin-3 n=1 Tax=Wickerhamomyces pijperi TaxID=599730 RepID=A0A9P8PMC6_WICPI|nr:hypothetical protein WICPIJ_009485 [Wickerhamomyces pijperi]